MLTRVALPVARRYTPLHLAALRGDVETVRLLLACHVQSMTAGHDVGGFSVSQWGQQQPGEQKSSASEATTTTTTTAAREIGVIGRREAHVPAAAHASLTVPLLPPAASQAQLPPPPPRPTTAIPPTCLPGPPVPRPPLPVLQMTRAGCATGVA